jgi:hypothetical protein
MSTTEMAPPDTKSSTTFEKLGFRPWTVDILENTLGEEYASDHYMDEASLNPPLLDEHIPQGEIPHDTPSILIGGFLDLAHLSMSPRSNQFSSRLNLHSPGLRMQEQEELTILKERMHKLECALKAERALRILLEEKMSASV